MSREALTAALWVIAACVVITWMEGVLRFIGLLWLAAQLVDLGRSRA